MLGAQTRAAEYNAAKKAQARQASREAEEQKAPPPAAPISLGAFSKPVNSRNKGNKAYVPLVLEATPEFDREDEEVDLDYHKTPTKRPAASTPSSRQSSSRLGEVDGNPRQQAVFNGSNPPSAPRSMIKTHANIQSTPIFAQRPQTIPAYHHNQSQLQQQVMFPPYPFQYGMAMVPPPEFGWPPQHAFMNHSYPFPPAAQHQPQPHHKQHPTPQPEARSAAFGSPGSASKQSAPPRSEQQPRRPIEIRQPPAEHVKEGPQENTRAKTIADQQSGFIPQLEDLEPSKQDDKMSNRFERCKVEEKRIQGEEAKQSSTGAYGMVTPREIKPIRLREPTSISKRDPTSVIESHDRDPVTPSPRPTLDRYSTQRSSHSQPHSLPNPLRQFRSIDDFDKEPVTAVPWMKSGNTTSGILSHDLDAQYDRAAKMQKFAAVQQSLNKQGKTVLNNPERKQTASVVSQIPSVCIDSTGGPGPAMPKEQANDLPTAKPQPTHASVFPPPGLQKPDKPLVPSNEGEVFQVVGDTDLHKAFSVGTAEWLELKVPNRADRKKMQDAMTYSRHKFSKRQSCHVPNATRWYTPDRAQAFFDDDTRWNLPARDRIHAIAEDYSMRWHAANGQPRPGYGEVDLPAGMVRGAGAMTVNLSEYWYGKKAEPDYFSRTKKVDDNAIDWGCIANGYVCDSLFGPDCMPSWTSGVKSAAKGEVGSAWESSTGSAWDSSAWDSQG